MKFPDNFSWCAATSHHQIEGGSFNDWTDFEASGHVIGGQKAGTANNHWADPKPLMNALSGIHANCYRLSIDWARVEPEPGRLDEAAIARYKYEIDSLFKRGIEPRITILHFTFPRWVASRGGWEWEGLPDAAAEFARVVRTRIAPRVTRYYTINEPMVTLLGGYQSGDLPPGEKRPFAEMRNAFLGVVRTHAAIYRALHEGDRPPHRLQVGIAQHMRVFRAKDFWNLLAQFSSGVIDNAWNWSILEATKTGRFKLSLPLQLEIDEEIPGLKGALDYVGVNYYSGDAVDFDILHASAVLVPLTEGPYTDHGWDIDAKGFDQILRGLESRFPGIPYEISENGIADGRDTRRASFLRDHLYYLHQAIERGANVLGYDYWSLADNFEWIYGYRKKLGLYRYDFALRRYELRKSGEFYRDIIRQNALMVDPTDIGKVDTFDVTKPATEALKITPKSKVYENATGCRLVITPAQDPNAEDSLLIQIAPSHRAAALAVWRVRLKDDVITHGPEECQDIVPFTHVQVVGDNGVLNCGHVDEYVRGRISLTRVDGQPFATKTLLTANELDLRYQEAVREYDASINVNHHVKPVTKRTLMREAFRCRGLRAKTGG